MRHRTAIVSSFMLVLLAAGCASKGGQPPAVSGPGAAVNAGGGPAVGDATGGSAAAIAIRPDLCTGADPGNDDRDHATPIPLGTKVQGCLQVREDQDFYEFTSPPSPAGGGVVTVNIADVGARAGVRSTAWAASDNGKIGSNYAGDGASVIQWFNVVPSTKYRVSVERSGGADTIPYSVEVTFTPVKDSFEPNDARAQASSIRVGSPVKAYLFAGRAASAPASAEAWDDWYKVRLTTGTVTVMLADVPSDIAGRITLHDPLGSQIQSEFAATPGASVQLKKTGLAPGDYYVKISPYAVPRADGTGQAIPQYATQTYTLTVTP